jgi:hypothetical protein
MQHDGMPLDGLQSPGMQHAGTQPVGMHPHAGMQLSGMPLVGLQPAGMQPAGMQRVGFQHACSRPAIAAAASVCPSKNVTKQHPKLSAMLLMQSSNWCKHAKITFDPWNQGCRGLQPFPLSALRALVVFAPVCSVFQVSIVLDGTRFSSAAPSCRRPVLYYMVVHLVHLMSVVHVGVGWDEHWFGAMRCLNMLVDGQLFGKAEGLSWCVKSHRFSGD